MNTVLCFTVRFLDPVPQFHGRSDDGDPEWPPSPLRFFQSLVSAAAQRWRDAQFRDYAQPALQWLERIQPSLVAPQVMAESFGYRMYVPNNSGDLMTAAWARGDTDTSMSKFRVEKDVRPLNLRDEAIRFLFPLSDGACPHFEVLQAAARSVTHLGWGIDMVAGNAELLTDEQAAALPGEVWRATPDRSGTALRISTEGTLNALLVKHQQFLGRLLEGSFKPVPPLSLSSFRVVHYRRATEPSQKQFTAFSILKPDASGMRSFDPLRRTRDVAGMVRHAVAVTAHDQDWTEERINVFIHGKTSDGSKPPNGQVSPDRFQYLPLPTINHALRRVESIRRVLIVAPSHCGQQTTWARRAMAGAELVNHDGVAAMLTILPSSDWVLRQYTEESTTWSTVTPVILPGYDNGRTAAQGVSTSWSLQGTHRTDRTGVAASRLSLRSRIGVTILAAREPQQCAPSSRLGQISGFRSRTNCGRQWTLSWLWAFREVRRLGERRSPSNANWGLCHSHHRVEARKAERMVATTLALLGVRVALAGT